MYRRTLPARRAMVCAALLPALLLLARPGRAVEEAELHRPIDAFFAGFDSRNIDAALKLWSPKSPYLAPQRRSFELQFARFPETRVRNVQWVRTWEDPKGAAARVTFDLDARDAAGKPDRALLGQQRTFELVQEMGAWHVWRYVGSERSLAENLLEAPDATARDRWLQLDAPLLSPALLTQLLQVAAQSTSGKPVATALATYGTVLEIAERLHDDGQVGRALKARGEMYFRNERYTEAEADLLRARPLLSKAGLLTEELSGRFDLGIIRLNQRRYREALAEFEAVDVAAEKAGVRTMAAEARYWMGYSRHSLLEHAAALTAYQSSADLYRELKLATKEARSLRGAGDVLKVLHRDAEAVKSWERSADLYRDAGDTRAETEVLYDIGLTYGVLGNYTAAYQAQSRRLKSAIALRDKKVMADSLSGLALTLGTLGQFESEANFLENEVKLRHSLPDPPGEAHARLELGESYRALSRFPEANDQFSSALEIARRIRDRDQEARILAAIGTLAGERGDFLSAAQAQEEAVRLFTELGLTSHVADTVRELGKQYRSQGKHTEALAKFQAALELDRQAEDLLGVARDLDESAQDHLLTGRFQDALTVYQETLKVYRQANLRLGEADIQNKLGASLQKLGRYTEAEAAFQQSLQISTELNIDAGQQQARANLAGLYATIGRYPEAIRGYEEALVRFRQLHARSSEGTALTNLGKLYSSKGDIPRSLQYHQEALAIYRELKDTRSIAQEQHSIADLNADRTHYAEALAGFAEAQRIFREGGLRSDEAITLAAQGGVYRQLGKMEEALGLYEQARAIHRQTGNLPALARVEANIGAVFLEQQRYAEALEIYQGALKTLHALGEKPAEPALLNNLGVVFQRTGKLEEARRALQRSLELSRQLGSRTEEALTQGQLGYVEQVAHHPVEAARNYRTALAMAGAAGLPDVSFRCWFGLGVLHREQKQWKAAAQDLEHATQLIEEIRSNVGEQSLQMSFLEQYVSPYHVQADCLLLAGDPTRALAAAEHAKARALVDVLRNGKIRIARQMTPSERAAEEKLGGELVAISSEVREARFLPTDQRLAREAKLTQTRTALEQFQRQLFLAHPQLQAQRGEFVPASLAELGRSLFHAEPGLCVLSYLVGNRDTLLFVLTRGRADNAPALLHVYRLPLSQKSLEERAHALWSSCSEPDAKYQDAAKALFHDLIQPAEAELKGRTHLVIVPDGPLNGLPFQVLLDGKGKHLIERLPLSFAPSVSALSAMVNLGNRRRHEPLPAQAPKLLALGRPKLDPGLPDLPATEKEARTVSRLFGSGAELALGEDASEERFKARASLARCLHLATHGLVSEEHPMYSALALAHGKGEDGRLEARELLDLDLHASLVVLSACETALGKSVRGEGVLSLTWSLFVAGAPSTIVTQWQVEDETTGALMARFYQGMLPATTGPKRPPVLSKAQALRTAQVAILRDGKHAHPYFWAPFHLVGDWRGGIGGETR